MTLDGGHVHHLFSNNCNERHGTEWRTMGITGVCRILKRWAEPGEWSPVDMLRSTKAEFSSEWPKNGVTLEM